MLHAVNRLLRRIIAIQTPQETHEPRTARTKEHAKVIASWYADGHFRLAIDRGSIDGVQRYDIYYCTHQQLKRLVCADDGRVLKTMYPGSFNCVVATVNEDWSECRLYGISNNSRPAGWRKGMDATFLHNGNY